MAGPKISLDKIEQTIDLSDFINVDLSDSRAVKLSIGQAMIDHILERTAKGDGMSFSGDSGRSVKLKSPYSKAYVDSLPFKAAGKKASKINMELTGDMLASMDIVSVDGNKITIAISEDQSPKAFNHLTGDTVPRRPWFGVSAGEVRDILKDFAPDIEQAVTEGETPDQTDRISLLDLFKDGEGD